MLDCLNRNQIVGSRIVGVFKSDPVEVDGVFTSSGYVLLGNDVGFELQSQDPLQTICIKHIPSEFIMRMPPVITGLGKTLIVSEVITSDLWPSLGLLIDNRFFLYMSDEGEPFHFEPTLSGVGEMYSLDEVRTYWGHLEMK